jgi:PadR family transcriptional regulator PadR
MSDKDRDKEPEIGNLETEMNRGFLHILVLALLEKDMYGYSMVKHIESLGYRVEENTLYPLLRRLEKNGWIASKWDLGEDRPRKFYAITDKGRALRTSLLGIWRTQDRILDKIAKENAHVQ